MKKILTLICAAALSLSLAVGAAAFVDITDETTAEAVETLWSMGLVSGTSATKYSPSLTLTRAQVCTMMVRAMGLDKTAESYVNQNLFTDVKNSMWHAGYVNLAYREGIIKGYGNGKFGPDDTVTYGQFVTILLRLLGYTESDIGNVWPNDYIVFASGKELDEGISLGANDAVSRADAAILLYNTLSVKAKGASAKFYTTLNGYASSSTAIILNNNDTNSKEGDLYVLVIGTNGIQMKNYEQKNRLSDTFVGAFGELLFNSSGKVIGFIPDDIDFSDIVISSAKISGITDALGNTYKISNSTSVICDGSLYAYGETGYVKVNSHANQSARLYTDNKGDVKYVYLTTGVTPLDASVVVATMDTAALELEEALGLSQKNYHVVKNGVNATRSSIVKYDVAYFDEMTNTLRVCDHRVTGYISVAAPSVSAAESITVSGCTLNVLECAWESLSQFTLGDYVTLLLTDEGSVAAAYAPDTFDGAVFGVLSVDGNSITLCQNGLVLTPSDISASPSLNGSLVQVKSFTEERMDCITVNKKISKSDVIDIAKNTLGDRKIAPGCAIYEWGGSGYVYSLEGEIGKSSSDFSAIYYTDTVESGYISYYHVNELNEVDIIVLDDVTGNYYEYGKLAFYPAEEGVLNYKALTITNDKYLKGSTKYIYMLSGATSNGGIALGNYNKNYQKVASVVKLAEVKNVLATSFYLSGEDEWYVTLPDAKIPVSDNVKVYIEPTDKWQSGIDGLLVALSSELNLTVYYDRTFTTGAQVRMIVVK